ncbi:MAG: prepilin-type N-terminal cleavage/methylation domain-containing protein [Chitinispirillaceae bacterium]|nr:prepilin-type N-terminal cleavage/methylation domain-containing protein [Chitinispirillaceae bacterium]
MKREANLQKGFTLIELSVAIIITSIVVTIVYSSWTYWNRYVARTQSKTELRIECSRILRQITSQLRKAKIILFWDRNRIGFVREDNGDTIVYSYDYNGEIKYNGEKMVLLTNGSSVVDFSIENQNNDRESGIYLFVIGITLKNSFNDTIRNESRVMVKSFEEDRSNIF